MSRNIEKVSVHGGHSGQYCEHARDSLEDVIKAYIDAGFSWVGITEHVPAVTTQFLYPDERAAGMTPDLLYQRFGRYIEECRRLQQKYAGELTIYVAMETETYSGSSGHIEKLLAEFRPDYIVGSVHHVDDIPFDFSREEYEKAIEHAGSLERLYLRYFDLQYEMLKQFRPAVVGHFDLIRMFDDEYEKRLRDDQIVARMERNLDFIAENGLILDYNLRSLLKGASEPYVSREVLGLVMQRGISVVPGDDSHGVSDIGINYERGIEMLRQAGVTATTWQKPQLSR